MTRESTSKKKRFHRPTVKRHDLTKITNLFTSNISLDLQNLILSVVWIVYAIGIIIFGFVTNVRKARLAELEIPCYFVMGKYDYITSVHAAQQFYEELEAPVKDFFLFEKSAHYPQFEEKERFEEWLNETWNQLSNGTIR